MEPHGRRRAALAAGTLLVGLLAAGCTSDDEGQKPASEPGGSPSASPSDGPFVAPLQVRPRVVTGALHPAARTKVANQVGKVVGGWFDAAYLGGKYPRTDFSKSFPGFAGGAVVRARRDLALMSNASVGPRVDGVRPTSRVVLVDILSPGRSPAAATAHFRLRFDTSGEAPQTVVVTGKLLLTPGGATA